MMKRVVKVVGFKLSRKERAMLHRKARQLGYGNVSYLLRRAVDSLLGTSLAERVDRRMMNPGEPEKSCERCGTPAHTLRRGLCWSCRYGKKSRVEEAVARSGEIDEVKEVSEEDVEDGREDA